MKKFIIAVIALMTMFPAIGNAQLVVKDNTKIETLSSARMGIVRLDRDGDTYFMCLTTTNQYDDPFLVYIGEDKDSAVQTMKDIVSLFDSIGKKDVVTIDNAGKDCLISKTMGTLYMSMAGYAGQANITRAELVKFLKALSPEDAAALE